MITTTNSTITANINLPAGAPSGYNDTTTLVMMHGPNGITTLANAVSAFTDSTTEAEGTLTLGNLPVSTDGIYRIKVYKTSQADIDDSTATSVSASMENIAEFSVRKITSVSVINV